MQKCTAQQEYALISKSHQRNWPNYTYPMCTFHHSGVMSVVSLSSIRAHPLQYPSGKHSLIPWSLSEAPTHSTKDHHGISKVVEFLCSLSSAPSIISESSINDHFLAHWTSRSPTSTINYNILAGCSPL